MGEEGALDAEEGRPLCPSRPAYRAGRKETAVKVYTVNQESRYLIVQNVPALKCADDLIKLFASYGPVDEYRMLEDVERAPFTDVYWIKYVQISNARFAKRKLDDYRFLASDLRVSYAPEYETTEDVLQKLEERQRVVLSKLVPKKQHAPGRERPPARIPTAFPADPLLAAQPPFPPQHHPPVQPFPNTPAQPQFSQPWLPHFGWGGYPPPSDRLPAQQGGRWQHMQPEGWLETGPPRGHRDEGPSQQQWHQTIDRGSSQATPTRHDLLTEVADGVRERLQRIEDGGQGVVGRVQAGQVVRVSQGGCSSGRVLSAEQGGHSAEVESSRPVVAHAKKPPDRAPPDEGTPAKKPRTDTRRRI